MRTPILPSISSLFVGVGLVVGLAALGVAPAWAQDGPDLPPLPGSLGGPLTPGPKIPVGPLAGPGGPVQPPPQIEPERDESPSATITSGDAGTGSATVQRVPCVPANTKVTMDFMDSPLLDVTKYMAEITCRNFILGDKLDGQVTIISHKQVSVAEAYEAYLSALEVAGYTTVTVGKNTKVIKTAQASQAPLRIGHDASIPETDNFVTQIIQLENVSVSSITSIISGLAGPSAKIITYDPSNTIIITDAGYNIRRVYRIVKELDVAAPRASLEVIPIRYAVAADVQRILESLYPPATSTASSSSAASAAPATTNRRRRRNEEPAAPAASGSVTSVSGEGSYISKMMSDDRTNALIVLANSDALAAIKDVIAKIDVDVDPYSRATIHVIQLNYAKAEDVANVLSNLTDGSRSGSSGSSRSTSSRSSSSSSRNTSRNTNSSRNVGAGFGKPGQSGGAGPEGLPGGAVPGVPTPAGGGSGGGSAAFDEGLRITADENTNRLLVVASPDDFKVLSRVVKELDVRRQQVFIEAVVIEVGGEDTLDTGIGVHGGIPTAAGGLSYGSGQLNASSLSLPLDTAGLISGLAVGVLAPAIDIPLLGADGSSSTISVPAFGIALNALASNSQVEILSNPSLLCVDNEEATINVGRNVPFPVSAGRDNNNNAIVSYQREDVGITLKVTPQINEANFVTMELNLQVQEVEEDSSGLDVNTAGFITSKRETENVVVVRDNQTIVIGGLIGNTETEVKTKIPILGDLPLVGVLFRGKRNVERKTNLLIFITPHVINEPADLEEVYRVKMLQRDEFLRRFYGKSREAQEGEFQALMRSSMNFIDQASEYRQKDAPDPGDGGFEIGGQSEAVPQPGLGPLSEPYTPRTRDAIPAPQPADEPADEPADGGGVDPDEEP